MWAADLPEEGEGCGKDGDADGGVWESDNSSCAACADDEVKGFGAACVYYTTGA